MPGNDQLPTHSALMQLRDERNIIIEAYDFLDEKRLLLATELLKQLEEYEVLNTDYNKLRERAEEALAEAIGRHGLQGLQVYPPYQLEQAKWSRQQAPFMGVTLIDTQFQAEPDVTENPVCNWSPEAEECRRMFLALIEAASVLAGITGNLNRLMAEYQRTERRARALENVVLPELEQDLRQMSGQLEELDQEETIRIHQRHN